MLSWDMDIHIHKRIHYPSVKIEFSVLVKTQTDSYCMLYLMGLYAGGSSIRSCFHTQGKLIFKWKLMYPLPSQYLASFFFRRKIWIKYSNSRYVVCIQLFLSSDALRLFFPNIVWLQRNVDTPLQINMLFLQLATHSPQSNCLCHVFALSLLLQQMCQ